ncbi:hypothetical protein JCM15765_12500 [Paradesulfitobacterium aromaticivorans]
MYTAMRDITTEILYVNAGTIGAEVHLPFGGTRGTSLYNPLAAQLHLPPVVGKGVVDWIAAIILVPSMAMCYHIDRELLEEEGLPVV